MGFFVHRPGGKSILASDVALMGWYPFLRSKTTDTTAVEIRPIGEKLGTGKNDEKTTYCGKTCLFQITLFISGWHEILAISE